jgi:hypothetical protein
VAGQLNAPKITMLRRRPNCGSSVDQGLAAAGMIRRTRKQDLRPFATTAVRSIVSSGTRRQGNRKPWQRRGNRRFSNHETHHRQDGTGTPGPINTGRRVSRLETAPITRRPVATRRTPTTLVTDHTMTQQGAHRSSCSPTQLVSHNKCGLQAPPAAGIERQPLRESPDWGVHTERAHNAGRWGHPGSVSSLLSILTVRTGRSSSEH